MTTGYSEGIISVNAKRGQTYKCKAKHIIWIPAGVPCAIHTSLQEGQYILIRFPYEFRKKTLVKARDYINLGTPKLGIPMGFNANALIKIAQNFLAENSMRSMLQAEALAVMAICELCSVWFHEGDSCKFTNCLNGKRLREVLEYIDHNCGNIRSVEELSERANLSKYYFTRLFKNATGITPHKYVTQRRLLKACDLLATTDQSIVNIALDLGFSSQSHMTGIFNELMGETPNSFRARVK